MGAQAGRELQADLACGATLDIHAADQLLLYMALARGISRFRVRDLSSHARTALWLLERLFPLRSRVTRQGALMDVELQSRLATGFS